MYNWYKEGLKNIWLPYTQMQSFPNPKIVKKTKDCNIILEDGTKLIDGISSWWSICHGYNNRKITKSIKRQLTSIPHIMLAGLANESTYKLASRISKFIKKNGEKEELNKVFFSDSGSTAIEVAIKIAIQYYLNQKIKNKTKIISFYNSYHGDTAGGMSLSDLDSGMHAKFKNYLPHNFITSIPDNNSEIEIFENFIKEKSKESAAIIIEPLIQCAGGMKFHNKEILNKIVKISKENNLLVIFDECATGFYRTGKKFAFHNIDLSPDIIVIGKALTGGFMTLAATISNKKIFNAFLDNSLEHALMHGPTFMGNPLSCSAAIASLDLFENNDYDHKVKIIEKTFKNELQIFNNHKLVKDIRVMGAVAVLELNKSNWELITKLRKLTLEEKIWIRPFSNVIYFMPPLTISKKQIKFLVNATKNALDKL